MGREIRMVSADWEHPRDKRTGHYKPLFEGSYKDVAEEWIKNFLAWEDGTHEDAAERKEECRYYWDWENFPPDQDCYQDPKWDDKPRTHIQMYETVSEGTPISPVFATKEEFVDWLVNVGEKRWPIGRRQYSREAAEAFVKRGWAPSLMVYNGPEECEVLDGVESCARSEEKS